MNKIVNKENFINIRTELKTQNKKIILCHGVFDLVHPGHIIHFEEARALGDVLVVSVTAEKYVRKGPGRPYFDDDMRIKFLASIECIDYVILSENYTVDDILKVVQPDLYVKGQEYSKAEEDITGKISEETELVRRYGGDVYFTQGQVFSSTKLINNALPSFSEETRNYLIELKSRYSLPKIQSDVQEMENLKVLVVGDVIIDDYNFCNVQGLMSKDMGYSTRFLKEEQYLGGALAVARHLAAFSNHVTICSVIGTEQEIHSRLLNDLSSSMRVDVVFSEKFKTIIKKRFVVENEKREEFQKIFSVNNLSQPMEVDSNARDKMKAKVKKSIEDYDLVVLCDFGHGLVDQELMDLLQEKAKVLTVNCQTNSSNYGMNLITKYKRADAFALDQKELKLAFSDYLKSEEESLVGLSKHLGSMGWLTRGSQGAIGIENGRLLSCPAFTLKVKDTIGAGDAFFSLASLCRGLEVSCEVGMFMGSIAAALASNIVGNKEAVDKVNFLKYASTLLNI